MIISSLLPILVNAANLSEMVKDGVDLKRYCRHYKLENEKKYSKWFEKEQVRKIISSNLQYFLMKQTIEDIAEISMKIGMSKTDYSRLGEALVDQSCSPNLTMIRPKQIKHMFEKIYSQAKPYIHEIDADRLGVSVNRFKQICSWNGKTDNYRMLSWYLSDHFTYAWLIKKNQESKKSVYCRDELCEIIDKNKFEDKHPLAAGSQDWQEDWTSTYCTHFKFITHDQRGQPEIINKWIDRFFANRTLYLTDLISHLSGESLKTGENALISWDALFTDYAELITLDWKNRSEKILQKRTGYIEHEEPLILFSVKDEKESERIIGNRLDIDVMVTAGEMDKSLGDENKITTEFSLKFPEQFFDWIKRSFDSTSPKDKILYSNLKKKLLMYFVKTLEEKKELFRKAPWEEQLPQLLTDVASRKLLLGKLANPSAAVSKKWSEVRVKLHYGVFALKHLYEMGPESGRQAKGINFKENINNF